MEIPGVSQDMNNIKGLWKAGICLPVSPLLKIGGFLQRL